MVGKLNLSTFNHQSIELKINLIVAHFFILKSTKLFLLKFLSISNLFGVKF